MTPADAPGMTVEQAHERLCRKSTEHGKNFLAAVDGIGASHDMALLDYLSQVQLSPRDWMIGFPPSWKTASAFKKARDALSMLLQLDGVRPADAPDGFLKTLRECFGKGSPVMTEVLAGRKGGGHDGCADDPDAGDPRDPGDPGDAADHVYRMRALCRKLAVTLADPVAADIFEALWDPVPGGGPEAREQLESRELESRAQIDRVVRLLLARAPPIVILDALTSAGAEV